MALLDRIFGRSKPAPKAAVQSIDGGITINTAAELDAYLKGLSTTGAGVPVTADTAMRVAAVFACVRIRSGVVANMPIHIKRRVDDRTREDVSDHPLWSVLRRKPNGWQTPSQFKRMMQAHLLLRGNAYALIGKTGDRVHTLLPLDPDSVEVKQDSAGRVTYEYTQPNGTRKTFPRERIFHLTGLTLDGVRGVSVITYARETIGLSMAMEQHGSSTFKNGLRPSSVLSHPGQLGEEGRLNLKASLDDFRSGGDMEGKALILEEGMEVKQISMTSEDAQWIESRKFSRSDIAMFFGIPPHMIGDTEKSTSWGTGIESQTQGFVTFSAEDDLTTWEETINRDLITDAAMYARFNRAALVRGDIKARWEAHTKGLQWGVVSPNEVRAVEDMNPREGGDTYYDPPNTAGGEKGQGDEPAEASEDQ